MDERTQPDAYIQLGTLTDGTTAVLLTEDGETYAVRLGDLLAWIREHGDRLSDEPTT